MKHRVAAKKGVACKEEGNALFKAGDLGDATRKYQEGYLECHSLLSRKSMGAAMGGAMGGGGGGMDPSMGMPKPKDSPQITELKEIQRDLMNNLTMVMFKKKRWDRVVH